MALGLFAGGCSGEHQDASVDSLDLTVSAATQSTPLTIDEGDPFVGMWDFDPEGGMTAEGNIGMLMIDEPCLYVVTAGWPFVVSDDFANEPLPIVLPSKRILGIARNNARFDPDTSRLWVNDKPLRSGDYISFSNAKRRAATPEEQSLCASTTITMAPTPSPAILQHIPDRLLEQLDSLSETEAMPVPETYSASEPDGSTDPLIGMWHYDPTEHGSSMLSIGMLMIDAPCIHIVKARAMPIVSEEGPDLYYSQLPFRPILGLPRNEIHFDAETSQIWFGDEGPMSTGDYIAIGHYADAGGPLSVDASPEEANNCSSTKKIRATRIHPWAVPDWLRERLSLSS